MVQQWIELKDGELIAVVPGTTIKQLDPTTLPSGKVRAGYQIVVGPPVDTEMLGLIISFEDESVRNAVFQQIRSHIEEGRPLIEWPGPNFGEVGPAMPFEARDEFEVSRTPFPGFDKGETE